jgi:hypothetical protein
MSHKEHQQALRTRPTPEGLKFWLDLICDIPVDCDLPDWEIPDVRRSRDPVGTLLRSFNTMISTRLSPAGQSWVRGARHVVVQKDFADAGERYRLLKAAHEMLRSIARRKTLPAIRLADTSEFLTLSVDGEGRIRFTCSSIVDALEGVEADRIRKCENPNCGRIYWAGRVDQPCCGKKCANARRVRTWRERYPEAYKQRRLSKPMAGRIDSDVNKEKKRGLPSRRRRRVVTNLLATQSPAKPE